MKFVDLRCAHFAGIIQFVKAPVPASKSSRLMGSANELSVDSTQTFELVDELERSILQCLVTQYSGASAAIVQKSGVHVPIEWRTSSVSVNKWVRVRVKFEGSQ